MGIEVWTMIDVMEARTGSSIKSDNLIDEVVHWAANRPTMQAAWIRENTDWFTRMFMEGFSLKRFSEILYGIVWSLSKSKSFAEYLFCTHESVRWEELIEFNDDYELGNFNDLNFFFQGKCCLFEYETDDFNRPNVHDVFVKMGLDLRNLVDNEGFPREILAQETKISLYDAARDNDAQTVKKLLANGEVDPDTSDFDRTPLHIACYNGNFEIVKYLVESGADPEKPDPCLRRPIHFAAAGGHEDVVRYLISKGVAIDVVTKVVERTPLHRAASSGHLNVAKVLIEAGADAGAGDEFGETALEKAEVFESEEVVLFLKNL